MSGRDTWFYMWTHRGSVGAMEKGCSQHVYVTCHVRLAPLCTEALC